MPYRFRVHLSFLFSGLVLITAFTFALSWGWALASVVPDERPVVRIISEFSPASVGQSRDVGASRHDIRSDHRDEDPHPSTEALDAHDAGAFVEGEQRQDQQSSDHIAALPSVSLPPVGIEMPGAVQGAPKLAIIIDDMGLAFRNSAAVVDLPGALTLSYLPYASDIQSQVNVALERGHEIMLHLPVEPMKSGLSAGPNAIVTGLSDDELKRRLDINLNSFTGYVGVNNHMGSRGTSSPSVMDIVMRDIAQRDVFFVDSWTSPRSVAYQTAAAMNVPRARRDIFLDHETGVAPVWQALRQAERMARRNGSAVVIGHPRDDTIAVLRAWLPMARARGVQIVPMSSLLYAGDMAGDPVLLMDAARHRTARASAEVALPKYDN